MSPEAGRHLLIALKAAAGRPGPQLGLDAGHGIRLRPIATDRRLQWAEDVRCLTEWRNRFVNAFLTEFVATEALTATWLAETIGPSDDRIMFMVDDDATTIGYMAVGFIDWQAGYGEADAIVRGRDAPKGSMARALRTMTDWSQGQLGIAKLGVRVRSDNPALEFYRKLGFVEQRRVPLSRRSEPGKVIWYENPSDVRSGVSLVYHLLGDR